MVKAEERIDGRTLRHQHRRPELLAAAVEYVLDHGIGDLSLRPMAAELGVTHATLLRHFTSREALLDEVVTTIRESIFRGRTASASNSPAPTLDAAMWAMWCRLCEPSERRQFALLFELVAANERAPGRFGDLSTTLITGFLGPLEAALQRHGVPRREARALATGYLAQVRGLQMDLSVTNDRRRVDAAMRHYIATVVAAMTPSVI